jgi:EamA domain-containing membrane protein RarD
MIDKIKKHCLPVLGVVLFIGSIVFSIFNNIFIKNIFDFYKMKNISISFFDIIFIRNSFNTIYILFFLILVPSLFNRTNINYKLSLIQSAILFFAFFIDLKAITNNNLISISTGYYLIPFFSMILFYVFFKKEFKFNFTSFFILIFLIYNLCFLSWYNIWPIVFSCLCFALSDILIAKNKSSPLINSLINNILLTLFSMYFINSNNLLEYLHNKDILLLALSGLCLQLCLFFSYSLISMKYLIPFRFLDILIVLWVDCKLYSLNTLLASLIIILNIYDLYKEITSKSKCDKL